MAHSYFSMMLVHAMVIVCVYVPNNQSVQATSAYKCMTHQSTGGEGLYPVLKFCSGVALVVVFGCPNPYFLCKH